MANFKINIGNWTEYRSDGSLEAPDNARQASAWVATSLNPVSVGVIATTSAQVLTGSCFQINTSITGTDYHYYTHSAGTAPFHANAYSKIGYTFEAQFKVVTMGTYASRIICKDEYNQIDLRLATDTIYLDAISATYPMDTTDDFHKYRFTVLGTALNFYVDGSFVTSGTIAATSTTPNASMWILWGDDQIMAAIGGNVLWSYFRYTLDGAFAPTERAMDGWVFDKFDISETRRKSQFPIIRSDNVVLPKGNMNASKIKLSGTVAGTCYDSFRGAVRRLKRLFHSGMQKVYLDDERYLEAIHSNFTFKPETQSYAKIKVSMTARNPYFSQIYPQYFSTTPVSAATFYITNNSDVPVPCKVIITGSAAGTIDDAMTIQNASLSQEAAYRGVISATQELVVDKGFDEFNTYKIELDGSSVYNSYEGDMFTLQSGVNAFVYTGTAAGTLEFYWREGYVA